MILIHLSHADTNYVQPAPAQPAPVKAAIAPPVDSLLNSDNNLSEELQPVLKPTSLISNTTDANSEGDK